MKPSIVSSLKWELSKIPKIIHFYWGNEKLSYLRYLSVYTFHKYNPDWEIRFYYPKHIQNNITWNTFEQKATQYIKNDYYPKLKKLPIAFIQIDFKILGLDNNISEVHKASFLRQHLLSTTGGVWSDMDILYFKSINHLALNIEENKDLDTLICNDIGGHRHAVAFVLSSENNDFYNFTYKRAKTMYKPKDYQCIGAALVNRLFPTIESINERFPDLKIGNILPETTYAYNALHIKEIYNSSDLSKFTDNSIGIHWYAGHPLASEYINKITAENYNDFNNVLCKTINCSLKGTKIIDAKSKICKPIFHYCVLTSNRGDTAIRESIKRNIQKYVSKIPIAYFNCKGEILSKKRIDQVNKDASALIIGGSGLYTNYPFDSGWYFPCSTELFSKIKVPIILLGIGNNKNLKGTILNDELNKKAKKSIKLINNLAVISTVRDQKTYNLLNTIGIKKQELLLDPANFLDCPNVEKEKRVAINIAQHSPLLGRFDGNNIIRNKNLLHFSTISNYLIKKGYEVVFIAHDCLEQSLIIDLKQLVPALKYINTDNIDKMLEEYAKCQFSIGVKMHSNILSFAAGTPFISVYYDIKSIEYLKLINYSDFGISIFDDYYDKLKTKVNKLIDNWEDYSDYFKRIKAKENIKFQKVIKKICNIVAPEVNLNETPDIIKNNKKEDLNTFIKISYKPNAIKLLWLYDSWNKPEYNHWFKIDFVKYLKDNFNLGILVYGKNSHKNYPDLSPIPFCNNKKIKNIKKEFDFDIIVIDSYNRNKTRSFDNIPKVPIVYIEGDFHSHCNNLNYINWVKKMNPTVILYRHKSSIAKAEKTLPQFKRIWFPCSVDTAIFKPNPKIKKINKMLFIGTNWDSRKKYIGFLERNKICDIFERTDDKTIQKKYSSQFYVEILQTYMAIFNHSGGSAENVDNAKMFEAMACGAILITNECANGVKELFPQGSYLTYPNLHQGYGKFVSIDKKWGRFQEIITNIISQLKNNMRKRQQIIGESLKCIGERHTHEIRGKEFIEIIKKIK